MFIWTLQDAVGLAILAGFGLFIIGLVIYYKAKEMTWNLRKRLGWRMDRG